jgi:phosphoglycerate kinase
MARQVIAMLTLDDVDMKGKTVFVRPDLNMPVDEKTLRVEKSDRLAGHAKTIAEIAKKGAKVVVLAHQGRKGDYDCVHLDQHAKLLSSEIGMPVKFVSDVAGEKAKAAISALKKCEILLLDNVRFLDDEAKFKTKEDYAKSILVKNLAPLCDIFVLDGFSVSHRAQASVVGFCQKKCVAGRVMQAELAALSKLKSPKKPVAFVLGGAKPEDSIGVMEVRLANGTMDYALTCGVLGSLFILASGRELGKTTDFLKEKKAIEYLPLARDLLAKYGSKIKFPTDVALDDNGKRKEADAQTLPSNLSIADIGSKTAAEYAKIIRSCKTVVINGPAGVYEKDEFSLGTREILHAIESGKAFSLAGGGHTISAMAKFGIDKSKIGYISLAGKALIEYLSGEKLPGVEILQAQKK